MGIRSMWCRMAIFRGKLEGISIDKTWTNYLRSEMAMGCLRGELLDTSTIVRIHSLKALNSW